jgi:hypothetical protein
MADAGIISVTSVPPACPTEALFLQVAVNQSNFPMGANEKSQTRRATQRMARLPGGIVDSSIRFTGLAGALARKTSASAFLISS